MIDVTSVEFKEDGEILIRGIDLDAIWIHKDDPDETEECLERCYKFSTEIAGNRKYLYLVTKNNKRANECTYMYERLEALVGQTIHLSPNFLVKE